MSIDMNTTRQYVMRSRADQVERTRQLILQATLDLAFRQPLVGIALPEIAGRAGFSVQTVLRQFGSREGLLDATERFAEREILAERETVPGDVDHAITTIVEHYERRGDGVLLLLGQEAWEPRAARITASGRALHREWVEQAFEPLLPACDAHEREALVDLIVVATDVFTWKLLRRDRGLGIVETRMRMRHLVAALLERK
jgi:AcrR family transcriptional regulator